MIRVDSAISVHQDSVIWPQASYQVWINLCDENVHFSRVSNLFNNVTMIGFLLLFVGFSQHRILWYDISLVSSVPV